MEDGVARVQQQVGDLPGRDDRRSAEGQRVRRLVTCGDFLTSGENHPDKRRNRREQPLAPHVVGTFLNSLALNPPHCIRGTAVFLAAETAGVPLVLLHHLKHNQVLHETVLLLTVTTEEIPRVRDADRVHVEPLSLGFHRVVARYGFMEEPDVPRVVAAAARLRAAKDEESRTTYYLGRLSVVPPSERRTGRMPRWRVSLFGYLKRNERSASMYFEIPPNRVVELGTRVEL